MESGPKSRALFERARRVMPSGVTSNFRYWGDDKTLVLKRGQGGHIWDQDDRRCIDCRLGFGPVILGHAHPAVLARVREALDMGNAFAMTHEYETAVAEKICELAGVDLVRFAASGTEATMHAIRIARAHTARNKVLKFEGHYHGFHDYTLWNCYPQMPSGGYGRSPIPTPHGSGIPAVIGGLVELLPFNDEELLEKKIKERWGEIACVIVEPITGNTAAIMPNPGYLELIRRLCDQHGIVMIIDEVKTGFRIGPGGAQQHFGVKADLACCAKALASRFPLAAVAGRKEIMGDIALGGIPHGGTHTGNAVATAAALGAFD